MKGKVTHEGYELEYDYGVTEPIKVLEGRFLTDIKVSDDRETVVFTMDDGESYLMYHDQDCCESVYLEEVVGDLKDLLGLIVSVEVTSNGGYDDYSESYTWTFYTIQSLKAFATLRWYGTSNGYYSESVDFARIVRFP